MTDRDAEVIVVGYSTESLRMSASAAEQLADSENLDLVQVNTKDGVPVVKLCDYSKLVYEAQKRAKELRKKQRQNQQATKEVKITYNTSDHDLEIKAKAVDKFLRDGDRVVMSIQFKGRTSKFVHNGIGKINSLVIFISEEYAVCQEPKIEGNKVVMIITAKAK